MGVFHYKKSMSQTHSSIIRINEKLYYLREMTIRQIAECAGVSVDCVKRKIKEQHNEETMERDYWFSYHFENGSATRRYRNTKK